MLDLADLVAQHPDTTIVTWAGITADMPVLREATDRHGLQEAMDPIFRRHMDLYAYANRSVRFPVPELGLKEISSYLALERLSDVTDGFGAVQLYGRMMWEPDPHRRGALRKRLTEYCEEDIDGLVQIARRLERGFLEPERLDAATAEPSAA